MILDALKKITADWAVAIISLTAGIGTVLTAYIKWRTDKGKIDGRFKIMEERMKIFENNFAEHTEQNDKQFETIHNENRDDHQLLFQRLDEIKSFLITGKFPD